MKILSTLIYFQLRFKKDALGTNGYQTYNKGDLFVAESGHTAFTSEMVAKFFSQKQVTNERGKYEFPESFDILRIVQQAIVDEENPVDPKELSKQLKRIYQ